jgi:hypothetical protein
LLLGTLALVEAHHFGELIFGEHVGYMVISPKGISSPDLWPRIVENAGKFAQRNKIKLFQTDENRINRLARAPEELTGRQPAGRGARAWRNASCA